MTITADNLKTACAELGLPADAPTLRRVSRAFDLYFRGKVEHIDNHSFIVQSQRIPDVSYRVQLKESRHLPAGAYSWCTCQDWRNYSGDQEWPDVYFFCKHSIASLLWFRRNKEEDGVEEFDWQKAKSKCVGLVGEANVGIIIYDLTQAGKLRQDSPSHYNRLEWFIIHLACQRDANEPKDPRSLNRWSYNSVVFLDRCREAIASESRFGVGH